MREVANGASMTPLTDRMNDGDRSSWIRIKTPTKSTTWTRGQPAMIDWEVLDKTVEFINISLFNENWQHQEAVDTEVGIRVPNTGKYRWTMVPWGLPQMQSYYVKFIPATTSNHRVCRSESFSIQSPTK